jgi:hypothetical protein
MLGICLPMSPDLTSPFCFVFVFFPAQMQHYKPLQGITITIPPFFIRPSYLEVNVSLIYVCAQLKQLPFIFFCIYYYFFYSSTRFSRTWPKRRSFASIMLRLHYKQIKKGAKWGNNRNNEIKNNLSEHIHHGWIRERAVLYYSPFLVWASRGIGFGVKWCVALYTHLIFKFIFITCRTKCMYRVTNCCVAV